MSWCPEAKRASKVGDLEETEYIWYTKGNKRDPRLSNGGKQIKEPRSKWVELPGGMKVETEKRLWGKTKWWIFPSPGPPGCRDADVAIKM